MLHFFAANWGTILIGLLVAAAVALILAKLWRDHKKANPPAAAIVHSAPHLGCATQIKRIKLYPKGVLTMRPERKHHKIHFAKAYRPARMKIRGRAVLFLEENDRRLYCNKFSTFTLFC